MGRSYSLLAVKRVRRMYTWSTLNLPRCRATIHRDLYFCSSLLFFAPASINPTKMCHFQRTFNDYALWKSQLVFKFRIKSAAIISFKVSWHRPYLGKKKIGKKIIFKRFLKCPQIYKKFWYSHVNQFEDEFKEIRFSNSKIRKINI